MTPSSELLWYVVYIAAAGVGALLVGIYLARVLRRRLLERRPPEAFTLEQLRQMRAAGTIDQQEFEAMRAAVIGRLGAAEPQPEARSGERPSADSTR